MADENFRIAECPSAPHPDIADGLPRTDQPMMGRWTMVLQFSIQCQPAYSVNDANKSITVVILRVIKKKQLTIKNTTLLCLKRPFY